MIVSRASGTTGIVSKCLSIPLIILTVLAFLGASAVALAAPKFSAISIDARTGSILYSNDPDGIRHPASLTKMMTLYLVFQDLKSGRIKLDSPIKFSARACNMAPSKLGVKPGATITVETAIKALVVKSANDVASAVAETLGGSEAKFAARMTDVARSIGMSRSTFRNASGLPNPGQVTTARDMATLGLRLMRDFPQYYPYFRAPSFTYGKSTIKTHNRLIGRYKGTDGIKTGFIQASGYNLVSSVRRGDKRLVGVVMGGKTGKSRNIYMMSMLDKGFAKAKDGKTIAALAGSSKGAIDPIANTAAEVASATPGQQADSKSLEQLAATAAQDPAKKSEPKVIEATVGGEQALPDKLPFEVKPETGEAAAPQAVAELEEANWNIQVGPYRDKLEAQRQLKSLKANAPDVLGGKKAFTVTVQKGGETIYRARFAGFTEAAAKDACRKLEKQAQSCYVLAPKS